MWKVYYRKKLDEHRTDQLTMTTRSTINFLSENSSKHGKYIPRQKKMIESLEKTPSCWKTVAILWKLEEKMKTEEKMTGTKSITGDPYPW